MATLNECFTLHDASDADRKMFAELAQTWKGDAAGLQKHLETLHTEEAQLREAIGVGAAPLNWASAETAKGAMKGTLSNRDFTTVQVDIDKLLNTAVNVLPADAKTGDANVIKDRIDTAKAHFRAGEPMNPAEAGLTDNGLVHLDDGRHRLVAAKQLGAQTVPLVVPTSEAQQIGAALGAAFVEQSQTRGVTDRTPELQAAAQKLKNGESVSQADYKTLVDEYKPVLPYNHVPKPETKKAMNRALSKDKKERLGAPRKLKNGHAVGIRLDIPAYRDHGAWVVSVHEQVGGFGAGPSIGYDSVAMINDVRLGVQEQAALSIATGKPKGTIAVMKGQWQNVSPAQAKKMADAALNDPQWRQVGMDPERHSFFYDRETQTPIVSADQVIQIGPLVLAKNPTFEKPEAFLFQDGEARFDPNHRLGLGRLYNSVQVAVEEMNLPAWKVEYTPQATPEVRARFAELSEVINKQWTDRQNEPNFDPTEAFDTPEYKERTELGLLINADEQGFTEKAAKEAAMASGSDIWGNLKGVNLPAGSNRKDAFKWTGIEEFLLADPTAKFTRQEVMNFLAGGGVQLQETLADQESASEADFDWSEGTVDSDHQFAQDQINSRAEDIAYEFENDEDGDSPYYESMQEEIQRILVEDYRIDYKALEEEVVERIGPKPDIENQTLDLFESDPDAALNDAQTEWQVQRDNQVKKMVEEEGHVMPSDLVQEAAEAVAASNYTDDPYFEYYDENSEYTIIGSDDLGYFLMTPHSGDYNFTNTYSFNEAAIHAREVAEENGDIDDEYSPNRPRWGEESYVVPGLFDNYREMKVVLPLEHSHSNDTHFPYDTNVLAFNRVTDRDLPLGERRVEPARRVTPVFEVEDRGSDTTFVSRYMGTVSDENGVVIASFGMNNQEQVDTMREGLKTPGKKINGKEIGEDGKLEIGEKIIDLGNRKVYMIDESQSDWANDGQKYGYARFEIPASKLKEYDESSMRKARDIFNTLSPPAAQRMKEIRAYFVDDLNDVETVVMIRTLALGDTAGLDTPKDKKIVFDMLKAARKDEILKAEIDPMIGAIEDAAAYWKQSKTEYYRIPDAPFVTDDGWMSLMLKRAIIDAVENGHQYIAWPNSASMEDRWSERYRKKYRIQYDDKFPALMARLTGQPIRTTDVRGNDVEAFQGETTRWPKKFIKKVKDTSIDEWLQKLETLENDEEAYGELFDQMDDVYRKAQNEMYAQGMPEEYKIHYGFQEGHEIELVVKTGDATGISGGQVVASGSNLKEVIAAAIEHRNDIENEGTYEYEINEGLYAVEITEELKAEVMANGFSLFQDNGNSAARGAFTPSDLITDQEGNPVNLLQIFEKGDPTTLLHESGHFWLEQLKSDAKQFGGGFDKDWATVRKWWSDNSLGLKDEAIRRAKKGKDKDAVAALQNMTDAAVKQFANTGELRGNGAGRYLATAMHEQFARGTEHYFSSGNAPSIALADAFIAFAQWFKSVYATMRGLDVEFSTEVKEVMDRMLAADEEIDLAFSQFELIGMIDNAQQVGMSQKQFAELQETIARSKNESKIKQTAKRLKEIKKERMKWWEEEKEAMRGIVRDEVAQLPSHRLVWTLTQGGLANGSSIPANEKLNRIERDTLKQFLPEGKSLADLPRVGRAIYEQGKNDGDTISPAAAAAAFGYENVEQMVDDLLNNWKDFSTEVEDRLDATMFDRHGPMDVEAEAIASVHGDHVARALAAELAALRTTEKVINPKFVRAYAQKRIQEMSVTEAQSGKFLTAERKAAKMAGAALKRGDRAEAYRLQFQRLLNHYMAAEAQKFQKKMQAETAYMRQFQNMKKKWKAVDAEYIDNIRLLIQAYDFGPRVSAARRAKAELAAVNDFVERMKTDDGAVLVLPEWLIDKDSKEHFKDLTVEKFNELHAGVKQLEAQGRLKNKLLVGAERRGRAETVAEMITALEAHPDSIQATLRKRFLTYGAKGKKAWATDVTSKAAVLAASFDAMLWKTEQLLEHIDGEPLGIWHQSIYQPFADAEARKQDLNAEVTEMINAYIAKLPKDVRQGMGKIVDVGDLGDGRPWTRGNLIMLALNTGNDSNLAKLVDGYAELEGWNCTEDLVFEALEQLSPEEEHLVQAIWDHSEKLYPSVEQIFRQENGVSPERINPKARTTRNGVELKGGYFPMFYDSSLTSKTNRMDDKNALEMMQSHTGQGSVNASITKGRTGFVAPVNLDITLLSRTMDTAIHYISHYPAVQNAKRIMGTIELREALDTKLGRPYTKQLDEWIGSLAANGLDRPPSDIFDKVASTLVTNTTVAVLGLSYSTMGAQTLGILTGYDRIMADGNYANLETAARASGAMSAELLKNLPLLAGKALSLGMVKSMSREHHERVFALSGEMRHRLQNTDRELKRALDHLKGKKGLRKRAQQNIMMMIAGMQLYTVDMPVWTAAYNIALRTDGDVERAVKYADRTVRLSQSAGGMKDLAAIQKKPGLWKAATMFYSFFSVLYGILREIGSETFRNLGPMGVLRGMSRIFVVLTLQELGMALLRGELPEWEPEDEDKDGMVKYLAKQTFLSGLATVPLGRDIVSGTISDFGYSPTPASMFGEAVQRSITRLAAVLDEDADAELLDMKTIKPILLTAGIVLGLPATQPARTLDGILAIIDEEDGAGFMDLLRGYDADREDHQE